MNDLQMLVSSITMTPMVINKWNSCNCPACHHIGHHRTDTRKRGGIYYGSCGEVTFNCFNCGFKTHYRPGFSIGKKFLSLMEYFGAGNEQKIELIIIAAKYKDVEIEDKPRNSFSYTPIQLPPDAKSFVEIASSEQIPLAFRKVVEYIGLRNKHIIDAFDLYWSPSKENQLYERFIIPFKMRDEIIGYTARSINPYSKMKYFNQYPSNILYGYDELHNPLNHIIFVTEGPINAGLIGGVATCHYTIRDIQLEWLKQTKKKIVIVPDRDKDGQKMVEQAIQNGFSVAFPMWETITSGENKKRINDIDEATRVYGRLYTLYSIYKSIEDDEFSIRVRSRQWF